MKIVVNGREFSSPDQMPPDVRAAYEQAMSALADKNGNGIPDILEMHLDPAKLNAAMCGASAGTTVISAQKFIINGREYDSVEQMPPEDRRHFEAIQSLASGSNVPLVRTKLDPLDPAEWAPSRGLLATNPITILFVVVVLTALVTCAVLAVIGALR
jgi:hypothetical protein